jgi:alkanesulfonate monooxygenase SsuD/methylene tetrahydromethanopterin reductase-like flavin-dependent oxidoreductase (luciferase family)
MYPSLLARSGLQPTGGVEDGELGDIAIAGTPHDCAERIRALHAAAASAIVVLPVGDDPRQQLKRIASDVLPLLRGPVHVEVST